jgi:hypothetical protein
VLGFLALALLVLATPFASADVPQVDPDHVRAITNALPKLDALIVGDDGLFTLDAPFVISHQCYRLGDDPSAATFATDGFEMSVPGTTLRDHRRNRSVPSGPRRDRADGFRLRRDRGVRPAGDRRSAGVTP